MVNVWRQFGLIGATLMFATVPLISQTGLGRPSHAADAVPTYSRDKSFPTTNSISFNEVSWIERDPSTALFYFLQRAQPPLSAWTSGGKLVRSWPSLVLGDPHSLSFSPKLKAWVTDMAPPQPAGSGYGHCLKQMKELTSVEMTIGTCSATSAGTGLDPVQFDEVTDIAWTRSGNLVVSDGDLNGLNNRVLQLSPHGKVLENWSAPNNQPGSSPGQFHLPHAVLVDACDRVWIADALNHRVQVMSADGTYRGSLTSFGDLGVYAEALVPDPTSAEQAVLFVGASPTSGGGVGRVSLFRVSMNCRVPAIADAPPFASFDVALQSGTSMTLLHSIAVDPTTWDVYLAVLGGAQPPQRWVANWPSRRTSPHHETPLAMPTHSERKP